MDPYIVPGWMWLAGSVAFLVIIFALVTFWSLPDATEISRDELDEEGPDDV